MTTKMRITSVIGLLGVALVAAACGRTVPLDPRPALESITDRGLAGDVEVLASDAFEGRQPGTRGEDLTVAYVEKRFKEMGLAPGNPNGSYTQRVPLLGVIATPSVSISIRGQDFGLRSPEDFVARSLLKQDRIIVTASPVLFAGYGIEAPEYGWNDYEGVDVKGKTLLVMLGEPSRPGRGESTGSDPEFFKGGEQTYYGTARYKREEAARRGASAILFVIGLANPLVYQAVVPAYRGEALDINEPGQALVAIQGAMPVARVRELLRLSGYDLDSLARRAQEAGFRGAALGVTMSFDLVLHSRTFESRNVVAKLQGSDPTLSDQYIVFSAHWDAFGRDATLEGDQIRNGAIDNAGGVAQMLAIAAAFQKLRRPPRRSMLFVATTGEESGLLGARYYARHPLFPIERTLATINFDNFFAYGRTTDVINFGDGRSELDDVLREAAGNQDRRIVPDPFPAEGFYFRMDHFEFANVGIPAVSYSMGVDVIGNPTGFGNQQVDEYMARDYHQPSDEVRPNWDYGGAVQDARMGFLVAVRVAEADRWPAWKSGAEFKARREAMLTGSTRRPD